MARIAFLTVGITSHVNAYSTFARQLQQRGHEVVFISPRDGVCHLVERRGFRFLLLKDEQVLLVFTEKTSQPFKNIQRFRISSVAALLLPNNVHGLPSGIVAFSPGARPHFVLY